MFERINSIGMYVVSAIGIVLMIMTMSSGLTPEQSECTDCGAVGSFIGLSYILLFVAIAAALGGAVWQTITNPTNIKGMVISIGGLALVLIVSYVLADGTVEPYYVGNVTETEVKLTDMGLYTLYFLFLGASGSIVYASVSKMLK